MKWQTLQLRLSATSTRRNGAAAARWWIAGALLCLLSACAPKPEDETDIRDYRPVLAHTRQRQAAAQTAWQIEQAISAFHLHLGRFPSNLVEIVRAGYLERIPNPPPGMGYLYDPSSGIFRVAPLPENPGPAQPE